MRRLLKIAFILGLALWLSNAHTLAAAEFPPPFPTPQADRAQSTTGPEPPSGVSLASGLTPSPSAVTITGVPAYNWHHGCGPTAAGMVLG
jgi:hypothetical protein